LDWAAAAAAVVVEAVLVTPKPPNEAVVELWPGAACPKANAFWLAA